VNDVEQKLIYCSQQQQQQQFATGLF